MDTGTEEAVSFETGAPARGELFVGRELGRPSPKPGDVDEGATGVGAGSGFDSSLGDCCNGGEERGDGTGEGSLLAPWFSPDFSGDDELLEGSVCFSPEEIGLPNNVGIDDELPKGLPNIDGGGDFEDFRDTGSAGRGNEGVAGEDFFEL